MQLDPPVAPDSWRRHTNCTGNVDDQRLSQDCLHKIDSPPCAYKNAEGTDPHGAEEYNLI